MILNFSAATGTVGYTAIGYSASFLATAGLSCSSLAGHFCRFITACCELRAYLFAHNVSDVFSSCFTFDYISSLCDV